MKILWIGSPENVKVDPIAFFSNLHHPRHAVSELEGQSHNVPGVSVTGGRIVDQTYVVITVTDAKALPWTSK